MQGAVQRLHPVAQPGEAAATASTGFLVGHLDGEPVARAMRTWAVTSPACLSG